MREPLSQDIRYLNVSDSPTPSHLGRDVPKTMPSNKDHAVYSDWCNLQRKCTPEDYHAVCLQYVALSSCPSGKLMVKSKLCKVPPNEGQRLDHATNVEASLSRQCRCHCS